LLTGATNYYSGDKIKKNNKTGACSMFEERRGANMVLVWKPKGKSPLGRPRHRQEDNIVKKWDVA
jgi:hypothetical protein